MRFRKKPKLVDAIQVKEIIENSPWPDWLRKAISAGKISIQATSVTTHIGRQMKVAHALDWIAYDIAQEMVYCVTDRTLKADYDALPEKEEYEGYLGQRGAR